MDTLIGGTLRMAIIHSGCTKPVCDQVQLDCYLQSLRNEDQQSVRKEKSETSFWLGNGKVFKSIKRVFLPAFIANKNVLLSTEVIENDIPLLLSKEAIKKAKTYIDFSKDKIIFFDEEAPVKFSFQMIEKIRIEIKNEILLWNYFVSSVIQIHRNLYHYWRMPMLMTNN